MGNGKLRISFSLVICVPASFPFCAPGNCAHSPLGIWVVDGGIEYILREEKGRIVICGWLPPPQSVSSSFILPYSTHSLLSLLRSNFIHSFLFWALHLKLPTKFASKMAAQIHCLFLLMFVVSFTHQQDPPNPPTGCGIGSSLQIDPTRPNNVIVAGINPSPGGNRYLMVQMDQLVRNICSQAMPVEMTKPLGRLLITRCDECTRCPQELPNIHRALGQFASQSRSSLAALLVILAKELDRLRPNARQLDNSLIKFVYSTDDDLGQLTFCDTDSADGESLKNFSKTSVLFVSISFIILIVISLAWLVFYYVQRFRYAHAKDRLQRRLFNAAKKALARIPTRPVKAGDKELCSDCPVCIDPYKPGDICRQLPCRHIFHKSCVDPWLLEHRTCPMCKSDILKAFGYHVSGRRRAQFSANVEEDGPTGEHDLHREGDRMSLESTGSESANPFHDVVTEVHDPFGFSPSSTSPQLVQMVHTGQNDFQIIPLAIQTPNPHCEIIQAPIERHHSIAIHPSDELPAPCHSTATEEMETKINTNENEQKTKKEEERPQSQSTSLRLFRAVTGRRRHVNANLVQISRSRSFSQSQITPIQMKNVGDGNIGTTKAIIYSVNNNAADGSKEEATMTNEKQTKNQAESSSRAVTAPEGFRRKVGNSQKGKLEAGSGTASAETRVVMEKINGTL